LEFPFDLKAALPRTRQSPDFPRPALADIRRYGRAFEKVSGSSKKSRQPDKEFEGHEKALWHDDERGKARSAGKSIKRGRDAGSILSS
jgi:hypothetical protein